MKDFIRSCEAAPRITSMSDFFSQTAAGKRNQPIREPDADQRLFETQKQCQFSKQLLLNSGPFVKHYFSSIPYSLEEECRLGTTIINFAEAYRPPFTVYCLGMAEGAMARTITQLSNGHVTTLTTSPTASNEASFYSNGTIPGAHFVCTPFFRLPRHLLEEKHAVFTDGFDIIIEDTTFQMYSSDRDLQIGFVSQFLKPGGLFIFTEKFSCDADEYSARERQKDNSYKRRFFTDSQLDAKRLAVLDTMAGNEVSLSEMKTALDKHFGYKVIYWNSGNFYSIVASSSKPNIERFLSLLGKACIPFEYIYCDLPEYL
ncbi:TPA: hypothetical protein RQO21_001744 [Klebsiella michiganensis]|nr:hypothetical protein [Klebsiella michiganensis]